MKFRLLSLHMGRQGRQGHSSEATWVPCRASVRPGSYRKHYLFDWRMVFSFGFVFLELVIAVVLAACRSLSPEP